MKKVLFFLLVLIIGFIYHASLLNAEVLELQWNTFLGGGDYDNNRNIALDSSGNIYVTGESIATWGTPINAHSGAEDASVASLDSSGNLLWNTFLGSGYRDFGLGIILDSSGNVYVAGGSNATWGSPVNAHSGDGNYDVFVACLDSSGNLLWNTFMGSAFDEFGYGIKIDSSGNVYVTGVSSATWGTPINAHSGGQDAFVTNLDSSGNLLWNTFLGSSDDDGGLGIVLDSSGNIYVAGHSYSTWGSPLNVHSGGADVFVVCLNGSGSLLWNTFLGSSSEDISRAIVLDSSENVYITGHSTATWGSPVNPYNNDRDAFVASLDNSGNLLWNTFIGSYTSDIGFGIAMSGSGDIYVTGDSNATWGSPVNAYSGKCDAFVACLDNSGNLLWNTFLGSADIDFGQGIALDSSGSIYVTGDSYATWGSPVNAYIGFEDVFVAKIIFPSPMPDIVANGSDGPISITQSDTLQIRVSLNSDGSTVNVDYWLVFEGPSGWYHFNYGTKKWVVGLGVTHQGPLMDLNNKKVFQKSGMTPGEYTFYFGVDLNMNGKVTKSCLYYDEVQVTVTSD